MHNNIRKTIGAFLVLLAVGLAIWLILRSSNVPDSDSLRTKSSHAAPVEVSPIMKGPIEGRRVFSGTLEARAEFVVAPKVSGRIEKLPLNISDPVERGQVVAQLDDDEYLQELAQAQADVKVAQANLAEARSALEIASRDLERVKTLRQRGVASESQLDATRAEESAKRAALEVARAQLVRAEAALETARIRLGYTRVTAGWNGGDNRRVVAERYADEGETVSANTSLLRIIELDPITGVIFATEKDYARLRAGQSILLETDAYPGEKFPGTIERIAPVFRQETRQARVELRVENDGQKLKPGMFIRATVVLDKIPDATIVSERALTTRDGRIGVFLVNEEDKTVSWRPVMLGIQEGGKVQVEVEGKSLSGRVVTLGQQLLDEGSAITIPGEKEKDPATSEQVDH